MGLQKASGREPGSYSFCLTLRTNIFRFFLVNNSAIVCTVIEGILYFISISLSQISRPKQRIVLKEAPYSDKEVPWHVCVYTDTE